MDFNIFCTFVIATALMISLPGPSVLLTVAHSLSFGWRRALATVSGATVGVAVQLLVAAIGLASLLHAVAEVFEWIRWAGAAYLVYLGIKQWRSANTPQTLESTTASLKSLFIQGIIITVPNPKSLIFIAAFLPQFIDMTRPLGLQFAIIVPCFLAITFIVTAAWALAAGKARRALRSQRASNRVSQGAGGIMVLAGVGLALARRSS